MDASTILEEYKDKELNEVPQCSLASDCSAPSPCNEPLTKEQLSPPIERYYINSKEQAVLSKLQEICTIYPIVVIHDLTTTFEIDLNVFSTESLLKANPNMPIDVHKQIKYSSDENWDTQQKTKIWKCFSYKSFSTIKNYAQYQAQIFLDDDVENVHANISTSSSPGQVTKDKEKRTIKFATNVDLSDVEIWKSQLHQLMKLPPFLNVKCTDNMLTYVGYDILGMNTVQLYMKVPGCRTTGHQENNNFCSVNINIGPGDCEWFAVSYEYWGIINSLCVQNGVNYLSDSWWPPDLNVLYRKNVPVYRFLQKPGDIVWVNVGCVHWVQAIGSCNTIAWNVGPFTARQYKLAIERYEWNKLNKFKSIVPMVRLSWRLACETKISNPQLFYLIKRCLKKTMIHNYLTLEFLKGHDMEVQYNNQLRKQAYYCHDCKAEVFNILFYKAKYKDIFEIYCIHCTLMKSLSLKQFCCLQKYHMEELMEIYDKFTVDY
ncbi:PREDICTED: histone demethylase UTY-like [Trachymyrmex septentrionalis]|uniref:histone demethylase UTY-like n=1 Tax=Trachymyrmex septentrionalis TaxID=34720 RepID=UPI00084F091F|nr:PREDICTED: histone demethylase UTY-like [Trachymyrmex septentrionalis]